MLGGELLRVPLGVAGPLEGPDPDIVGPDVVGMAVAAEGVIGRHDVRPVLANEPGHAARGLVEVGLPEAPRIDVPDAAHHVRVAVAEVLPLGDPEVGHGRLQLRGPDLPQPAVILGGVHLRDDDLALLTSGARHEHHPVALLDRLCHQATRTDRLVVGVGVRGHERERHGGDGTFVARTHSGARRMLPR
jgi:hypothetical protein